MQSAGRALECPLPFRLADRAVRLCWTTGLAAAPQLSLPEFEAEAVRQTGHADFGDPWFRGPLRILLESIEHEARLSALGRLVARTHVLKLLRDRLRAESWFADCPEIRARPLAPPVVVAGPMRSGTTRLHRLLAADSRFSHLRLFETICPVPARAALGARDWRPRIAGMGLALLHRANPDTAIVHPTGPFEPEEELGLFISSAWGMKHEAQWRVPGYGRWCEQTSAVPAYRQMADLLRLTGWFRGDDPVKPWILKTPQHMLDLPALLEVFPRARIIFIHRDPTALVGSSCSLVWNQMKAQSAHADRVWIGREWLRKTRLKIDRMQAARAGLPASRAIDVHYAEMERDWHGAMRRIYRFLDLDLAPAEPAMEAYMARAEGSVAFRSHRYRLEDFGLSAGTVNESFENYIERYDIPVAQEPERDRPLWAMQPARSAQEPIARPAALPR